MVCLQGAVELGSKAAEQGRSEATHRLAQAQVAPQDGHLLANEIHNLAGSDLIATGVVCRGLGHGDVDCVQLAVQGLTEFHWGKAWLESLGCADSWLQVLAVGHPKGHGIGLEVDGHDDLGLAVDLLM